MAADYPQEQRTTHYTYQLPTRLIIEDQLISLGPLSLTLRQSFVLTLAACLAINVWRAGDHLTGWTSVDTIVRLVITALPLLLGLIWSFLRFSHRTLETWTLILVNYALLPKQYRWCSVCQQADPYYTQLLQQHHTLSALADEEESV